MEDNKSQKVILAVDDNLLNLKLVDYLLKAKGYEVKCAVDAEVAIKMLETLTPDLILMDIQLPGIDGLELTRQLKAQAKFKDTPIVAITAYAMKGDKEKALEAGCDGYITKPIDTKTLPDIIAGYLSVK